MAELKDARWVLPPKQFRVYPKDAGIACSVDSVVTPLGDLLLECHPALPLALYRDGTGANAAAILGLAFDVDNKGALIGGKLLDALSSRDPHSALEAFYESLFGSFILIVRLGDDYYLYLDAAGTLSAVYSSERKMVGATATAILTSGEYNEQFNRSLYDRLDVFHDGWFPSTLTAHQNVRRLLCNHRLNLRDMQATRHWPLQAPARVSAAEPITAAIASSMRKNINSVCDAFVCALALTGGRDSRTLLSLCRGRAQKLLTYTVAAKYAQVEMDLFLADRLAKMAGVHHLPLIVPPVDEATVLQWRLRCGHAVGGANGHLHVALQGLEGAQAILDGAAAETARAFFWRDYDSVTSDIDAQKICQRFGMALDDEVIAATDQWLSGVPKGDIHFILDLAYLELRVAPWAFAQSYADPSLHHFSPFASRAVVSLMFQLPIAFKKADALGPTIIEKEWPELLSVPFNRYGDYRDAVRLFRKATNLRNWKSKLRKMLAR